MSFPQFNSEYAIQTALYLLNKADNKAMECVKLMKLLYFADREYLIQNSSFISTDTYVKMEKGPVPINLFNAFKVGNEFVAIDGKNYRALADVNLDKLAGAETECLDKIFNAYYSIPTPELIELSHQLAWNSVNELENLKVEDIVKEVTDSDSSVDENEVLDYYYENLELDKIFA